MRIKMRIMILAVSVGLLVSYIALAIFYANKNQKLIQSFHADSYQNPYRLGQSMDKIDFSEFNRYFPNTMVPMIARSDQVAEIPMTMSYYSAPDDEVEPAFQIDSGTRIILYSDDIPMKGYGVQSWPTYQREWRYAAPFYVESDKPKIDSTERPMFYVRYSDLRRLVNALDREGILRQAFETAEGVTPGMVVTSIDLALYRAGGYLSPSLLKDPWGARIWMLAVGVGGLCIWFLLSVRCKRSKK